jgi:CubicO group peptidase (beta-lactamase class C family)
MLLLSRSARWVRPLALGLLALASIIQLLNGSPTPPHLRAAEKLVDLAFLATFVTPGVVRSVRSRMSPRSVVGDGPGRDLVAQRSASAVAVVTLAPSATHTYTAAAEQAELPSVTTDLFEIGSLTKVFTGLLLATLVGSGDLELDTRLGAISPAFSGRLGQVTLRELASHTSGLPRLPITPGFLVPLVIGMPDPYRRLTRSGLLRGCRAGLVVRRPVRLRYSNAGFMLLGVALERAMTASYQNLLVDRVLLPLRMTSTTFADCTGDAALRPGHTRTGLLTPAWHGCGAAGGLRSNAADLRTFVHAVATSQSPLEAAIDLTLQPHAGVGRQRMGLGWVLTDGPRPIAWHNGATGGFSSYMAVCRRARAGVVVLSDTQNPHAVDDLGGAALRSLLA